MITMTIFATLSLIAGALLAQRFRVSILVPALLLGLVVSVVGGIAQGQEIWGVALQTLVVVAGLQIGFLVGSLLRLARTLTRDKLARSRRMGAPQLHS
jgi:hypothetical protein